MLAPSNGCTDDFLGPQAMLSVDSAGKVLVAYTLNTTAGAPKGLYVRTSTDGATWSARQQLNSLGDSGFPVVSHGPDRRRLPRCVARQQERRERIQHVVHAHHQRRRYLVERRAAVRSRDGCAVQDGRRIYVPLR